MLAIARSKAERAGAAVRFEARAVTDELADLGSFDRGVASLVMHHLDAVTRVTALRRAHAALRAGGRVHVVDFGPPSSRRMRLAFYAIQLLDGFETTADRAALLQPRRRRQVHRGCGRDVIVHCASTSAAIVCRPTYVSRPDPATK